MRLKTVYGDIVRSVYRHLIPNNISGSIVTEPLFDYIDFDVLSLMIEHSTRLSVYIPTMEAIDNRMFEYDDRGDDDGIIIG